MKTCAGFIAVIAGFIGLIVAAVDFCEYLDGWRDGKYSCISTAPGWYSPGPFFVGTYDDAFFAAKKSVKLKTGRCY